MAFGTCKGCLTAAALTLACCASADGDVAALQREVSQLRVDVDTLTERVALLSDKRREETSRSGAPTGALRDEASRETAVEASRAGPVQLTFIVEPADAEITVAGEPVRGGTWQGERSEDSRLIRVRRAGYRVIEQAVRPDQDRALRYKLLPGRGIQRLPTR